MDLRSGLICLAAMLSACASGDAKPPTIAVVMPTEPGKHRPVVNLPTAPVDPDRDRDRVLVTGSRAMLRKGNLETYLHALSDASCPSGAAGATGEAARLTVTSAQLGASTPSPKKIGDLTWVAGFTLSSDDKRFGGLSDIDVLDNGNLVAVSDAGAFVWIDLAADGLTPIRTRISPMHDAAGALIEGKADSDAEGVSVNDGIAVVSFEQNHRVLAFDLGRCGAMARGAPIVFGPYGLPLTDAFDYAGIPLTDRGVGALAVTPRWYLFSGVRTKLGDLSPLSARPIEADPDFSLRVGVEVPELTGLDVLSQPGDDNRVRAFLLHRSAEGGGASTITETDLQLFLGEGGGGELEARAHTRFVETGWKVLATIDPPAGATNFEGIAAKSMPDGRVRLFVVSNNGFSAGQGTLLLVFDLQAPLR
jgi:Esterase-like activity of phytase